MVKPMSFQWLNMRISEEQDRQHRESEILERLPRALAEVHAGLTACVESYTAAFGPDSAELETHPNGIRIIVRELRDGKSEQRAAVDVQIVPTLPGFQVDRGAGEPLLIEVGVLPGDRLFYRDRELDQYLTMDEMTRRMLDRALFPKLKE
jgi:hypothetical protein